MVHGSDRINLPLDEIYILEDTTGEDRKGGGDLASTAPKSLLRKLGMYVVKLKSCFVRFTKNTQSLNTILLFKKKVRGKEQ